MGTNKFQPRFYHPQNIRHFMSNTSLISSVSRTSLVMLSYALLCLYQQYLGFYHIYHKCLLNHLILCQQHECIYSSIPVVSLVVTNKEISDQQIKYLQNDEYSIATKEHIQKNREYLNELILQTVAS